jgi:hypothetical protein
MGPHQTARADRLVHPELRGVRFWGGGQDGLRLLLERLCGLVSGPQYRRLELWALMDPVAKTGVHKYSACPKGGKALLESERLVWCAKEAPPSATVGCIVSEEPKAPVGKLQGVQLGCPLQVHRGE